MAGTHFRGVRVREMRMTRACVAPSSREFVFHSPTTRADRPEGDPCLSLPCPVRRCSEMVLQGVCCVAFSAMNNLAGTVPVMVAVTVVMSPTVLVPKLTAVLPSLAPSAWNVTRSVDQT